jgi:hypothetical protein
MGHRRTCCLSGPCVTLWNWTGPFDSLTIYLLVMKRNREVPGLWLKKRPWKQALIRRPMASGRWWGCVPRKEPRCPWESKWWRRPCSTPQELGGTWRKGKLFHLPQGDPRCPSKWVTAGSGAQEAWRPVTPAFISLYLAPGIFEKPLNFLHSFFPSLPPF